MPAPRSHRRARLAVLVSVALAFTGLQLFAPPAANAVGSTGLVIKEVYGAGGNGGATYNADFVELYNPQATASRIDGHVRAVPLRGRRGRRVTRALPGKSVPAGGHYLDPDERDRGASGAALPRRQPGREPGDQHGRGWRSGDPRPPRPYGDRATRLGSGAA